MPTLTPYASTCLARQGFDPDDADVGRVQLALRFTPALCLALVAVAVLTRSALLLGALAVAAAVAATGRPHVFDLLYDAAIRPLVDGPRLPSNPSPRRFAFVLATPVLAAAAIAMAVGATGVGGAIGLAQMAACTLYVATGWCPASFAHNLAFGSYAGQRHVRA